MRPARNLALLGLTALTLAQGPYDRTAGPAASHRRLSLVARPLAFEANNGQSDASVRFLARGAGGTAFLTDTGAVLAAPTGTLRIRPATAAAPTAEGIDELPGKVNYLVGNDPSRWRVGVPTFASVRCAEVWQGIDLVWHASDDGRLEYDFVVAPGADPAEIAVEFAGADDLTIDDDGGIVAHAGGAEFRQPVPVVYEVEGGARRTVEGRYVMDGADRVRFAVAGRDPSRTLFIDPVVYATYLGGSDGSGGLERILGMTKDSLGNIYACGGTTSADFPLSGAIQGTYGGGGGFTRGDAFVSKIDPTGSTVLYSTYIGGSQDDEAYGIAIDGLGNALVGGIAYSTDFPTTVGALSRTYVSAGDGFVSKLNQDGSAFGYSTYTGGSASGVYGIAANQAGEAFCVGGVSGTFPTTATAVQKTFGGGTEDALVLRVSAAGDALVYATYLGGSSFDRGLGIAVNGNDEAFVTGYTSSADFPVAPAIVTKSAGPPGGTKLIPVGTAHQRSFGGGSFDGFVAHLDPQGAALVFSTYLGGSGEDLALDPALDGLGNLYVPGYTTSTDFPTVSPAQPANGGGRDAFLTKFSGGGDVGWSTYLGGAGDEIGYATATTAGGVTWMAGSTQSADLPLVNAPRTTLGGGTDAFLARIGATGAAFDAVSYAGGGGDDYGLAIVLDAAGEPLLGGQTSSADLRVTSGALQTAYGGGSNDAFVSSLPGAVAITSFFLPKKVTAKVNPKAVSKSTLVAGGIFDTGPDAPDFASAATLDVGGLHFDIPGLTPSGTGFSFSGNGVALSIAPNPYGSSRAKFKLKYTGDLTGKVSPDGPLDLHFANSITDGGGTVELGGGVFGLGKVRGALVEPNLFVVRAHATLKGAGKDAFTVIVGLATNGQVPAIAQDLTVGFTDRVSQTVPSASFSRKASTDQFSGDLGGITRVIVDYAREQIAITGKGLDLGNFAPGGNSVLVTVGLGNDVRAVQVRMGRIGNTMKY